VCYTLFMIKQLFLLISFTAILFSADKTLEKVSIQLKWFYQFQFAGVIMAKEKGFYEEAGLDVTVKERNASKNNILQVANGESEYGIADSTILRYRSQGKPVRVTAAIFQHNALVLISKRGSGIISPYEMKGKRVSYQEGLDDSTISSLLAFAGLKESDYVKVPMDFSHMDFVNGKVDVTEAYISSEPFWIKEKHGIDVNIIDPKSYGIDFYGDLLFTTHKEIDEHPKRVAAFTDATLKGWRYALENVDETINVIIKDYNTQGMSYEGLLYEAQVIETLVAPKFVELGKVEKERFVQLGILYASHGINQKQLDEAVETIIYNPDRQETFLDIYFYPILWTGLILILFVLLLFLYNRRLSHLVAQRTKELKAGLDELRENRDQLSKSLSELKQTHEMMLRQSRQAAMGEMIGMIAHQWRQPLSSIATTVNTLEMKRSLGTFSDEDLNEQLNNISSYTQHMSKTIDDFRGFFKEQKETQNSTLEKIIDESVDIIKPTLKTSNISVSTHYLCNEELPLYTNELKQVLLNLLKNSQDALEHKEIEDKKIGIQTYKRNGKYCIYLQDNAGGVPYAIINKIFEPYFTTKNARNGTGLGLYMSKIIVEEHHNGYIRVENRDQGARFIIELSRPD